jgi:hypothetical protein
MVAVAAVVMDVDLGPCGCVEVGGGGFSGGIAAEAADNVKLDTNQCHHYTNKLRATSVEEFG